MKKINIIITLSLLILLTIASCGKDGEELPTNDPTGNYLYESNSVYYHADGSIERKTNSNGSLAIENKDSKLFIEVTPSIGYTFTITANNLQTHGDTTTFSIYRQQIELKDNNYNVQGVNGVDVGNLGKYDGYFTDKVFVFDYRSVNIESLEWVETRTDALKRN